MFSPAPAPDPPRTSTFASPAAPTSWRDALRHAADRTLAFTTLESYTVEDVWPPRRRAVPAIPSAPTSGGATAGAAAVPQEHRRVDLQMPQPSRRRAPASPRRRAGATRARAQPCISPVPTAAGGARPVGAAARPGGAGTRPSAAGTRPTALGAAAATRSAPATAAARGATAGQPESWRSGAPLA